MTRQSTGWVNAQTGWPGATSSTSVESLTTSVPLTSTCTIPSEKLIRHVVGRPIDHPARVEQG